MQKSFSELEYAAKKNQTRRDIFLDELERITPWAALEQGIAPFYPNSGSPGRPPIGLARMLRMYVAQQCFGLSDEGMEDAIYDSQAIRRTVLDQEPEGRTRSGNAPDQEGQPVVCVTNTGVNLWCCTEDGSRPPGIGLQELIPNRPVLLRSKGAVVSDRGKVTV